MKTILSGDRWHAALDPNNPGHILFDSSGADLGGAYLWDVSYSKGIKALQNVKGFADVSNYGIGGILLDGKPFMFDYVRSFTDASREYIMSWTNLKKIALDFYEANAVGLQENGEIFAIGNNVIYDFKNVEGTYLQNVVDFSYSVGRGNFLALFSDETVQQYGIGEFNTNINTSTWTGIKSILMQGNQAFGIQTDGTVLGSNVHVDSQAALSWTGVKEFINIRAMDKVGAIFEDGTVMNTGNSYDTSLWTDVQQVSFGIHHVVGLKSDGSFEYEGNVYAEGAEVFPTWTAATSPTEDQPIFVLTQSDLESAKTTLASAAFSSYALDIDVSGKVKGYGANDYGHFASLSTITDADELASISPFGRDLIYLDSLGAVKKLGTNYTFSTAFTNVSHIAYSDFSSNTEIMRPTLLVTKNDGTVEYSGGSYFSTDNLASWTDIRKTAVTNNNVIALKNDGSIIAVGDNTNGQLSLNGVTGVSDIAATFNGLAVLKQDGTVSFSGSFTSPIWEFVSVEGGGEGEGF